MGYKDQRKRLWAKVRLPDSDDAREAYRVIGDWLKLRTAARNMTRAILMYAALLKGDSSRLAEYFPGMGISLGAPRPMVGYKLSAPVQVEYVAQSDDEKLDDALDLFGGAEF
jgi:hypothetical protein